MAGSAWTHVMDSWFLNLQMTWVGREGDGCEVRNSPLFPTPTFAIWETGVIFKTLFFADCFLDPLSLPDTLCGSGVGASHPSGDAGGSH